MDGFSLTLVSMLPWEAANFTHEVSGLPNARFSFSSPTLLRDGFLQGCSAEPWELLSHPLISTKRTSLFPTNPPVFLVTPHFTSFHHHTWDSPISSPSLAHRLQKEKMEKRSLIFLRELYSVYICKIS